MNDRLFAPKPFADFLIARLLRRVSDLPGITIKAMAETEHPFGGDDWYWADDNAKILELLSVPEIWRCYKAEMADVLHFVLSMFDGPLIYRRVARPRLECHGKRTIIHSFLDICGDVSTGKVSLGMRFHDGRTARNVILTGNYVRFRFKGEVYTIDVEETISDSGMEQIGSEINLWWKSSIEVALEKESTPVKIGDLVYSCRVRANSTVFDVSADFAIDPFVEISDVALTIGYDDLSHNENNIRYEAVSVLLPGGSQQIVQSHKKRNMVISCGGSSYWAVFQLSEVPGFATGVHSMPKEPAKISEIKTTSDEHGRLHWVVAEYAFPGIQKGRVTAAERKLITSGGLYGMGEIYRDLLERWNGARETTAVPTDFSISYDYGAEMHSLARCYRVLSSPDAPVSDPALHEKLRLNLDALRKVYDEYFQKPAQGQSSQIYSRSIAFVALAYAEMVKATGDQGYICSLREACDVITSFERRNTAVDGSLQSGFVMSFAEDSLPYADCHLACLLALAKACVVLKEDSWLEAIDRGLAAFCIDTISIDFLGPKKQDIVAIDYLDNNGQRRTMEMFWNYKSGLCLRLFNLLKSTDHKGIRSIWAKHDERLSVLETLLQIRLRKSLRYHEDGMEILTSVLSSETNSETQPWVALGLCGDAEVLSCR